jgi:signal transduction histidine kinase
MMAAHAAPPRVKPRRSLSARLWLLATLAVLLSEVVVFLPYIAHERRNWLLEHIDEAAIAALAGRNLQPPMQDELLLLANGQAIRLVGHDGNALSIGQADAQADATIDLREEDGWVGTRRALRAILLPRDRLLLVIGRSPFPQEATVELWLNESVLNRSLRQSAGDFVVLSLLIAGITGGLVYLAVLLLLVRPMRRITGSIAAFRADPERMTPLNPSDVTILPDDEMAVAGRELAAMQHELRTALWRNARLAGLGTVVAKVSHDLRGILTPALLSAERLQMHADPRVQRAGDVLAQAVDRAADLVRRTLEYAREGPPPLQFGPVALAPLVNEAAETARPPRSTLRVNNGIDAAIQVLADRIELFRVLTNLLRNAAEAGARTVRISAQHAGAALSVDIADDGPGLPEPVRAELFRPFAGSTRRGGTGLGLAIARDLMVAHGGQIELVETDTTGTTFRLTLRLVDPTQQSESGENGARIAPAAAADV